MHPLICKSTALHEVARRIERAARADSPVLLYGEPGSGKKLVAETIHRRSRRGAGPLVIVPTDDRSTESLEDELFGTEGRQGGFAAAEGGTLLIDEITGLPRTAQAKLLEAAESRYMAAENHCGRPRLDFRLMATTRHDLSESVKRRCLREDLHYRLSVVTIHVPALRQRKEDIPPLVGQMLAELCGGRGRRVPSVARDLMQYLVEQPWPGNGRQLRDCLEKMLPEGDAETLGMNDLPSSLVDIARDSEHPRRRRRIDTLAELERAAVMSALDAHQGNRTQAARTLGISVRTLQRKLRQWGA